MRFVATVLVLAMLASGCSWARRAKHHRARRDAGTQTPPDHGALPPVATHVARVVRAVGATHADGSPVVVGEHLGVESWIDVADGGALVLDWTIDTRAEVEGGSRIRVGDARPSELWLAYGAARGILSPGPTGLRAPLHIGTPEIAVDLPGNGDVYVFARRGSRGTLTFVLSGAAELRPGTLGDDGRPVTLDVHPSQGAMDGHLIEGVTTIDEARARVFGSDDDLPRPPQLDEQLALLDTALVDLEREDVARRAALALPSPPQGSPEAHARLGEMIAAGQRQLWKRAALLAAWDRAQAAAGGLPSDLAAPLASRDERVHVALGASD